MTADPMCIRCRRLKSEHEQTSPIDWPESKVLPRRIA